MGCASIAQPNFLLVILREFLAFSALTELRVEKRLVGFFGLGLPSELLEGTSLIDSVTPYLTVDVGRVSTGMLLVLNKQFTEVAGVVQRRLVLLCRHAVVGNVNQSGNGVLIGIVAVGAVNVLAVLLADSPVLT